MKEEVHATGKKVYRSTSARKNQPPAPKKGGEPRRRGTGRKKNVLPSLRPDPLKERKEYLQPERRASTIEKESMRGSQKKEGKVPRPL